MTMPDPPTCADCGKVRDRYYGVTPPEGKPYVICWSCWDHMIGLATMQAFR